MNLIYKNKIVKIIQLKREWQRLSKSRTWLQSKIKREVIDRLPFLTDTEKARLYRTVISTVYSTEPSTAKGTDRSTAPSTGRKKGTDLTKYLENQLIDSLIKVFNQLDRKIQKRTKAQNIKKTLQENRSLAVPIIFYICSQHGNAAKDHAPYQGKIYVDRFWRNVCKTANQPEFIIKAIEKYISRNDIKTIQWVMGPPVYMVTRPYCKHYFTPVPTLDVLTSVITPPKHKKVFLKPGDTKRYIQNKLV